MMLCDHGYWMHGEAYWSPHQELNSVYAKHDVYDNDFIQAWKSSGEFEICHGGHPARG
jgi:hypothetical protein